MLNINKNKHLIEKQIKNIELSNKFNVFLFDNIFEEINKNRISAKELIQIKKILYKYNIKNVFELLDLYEEIFSIMKKSNNKIANLIEMLTKEINFCENKIKEKDEIIKKALDTNDRTSWIVASTEKEKLNKLLLFKNKTLQSLLIKESDCVITKELYTQNNIMKKLNAQKITMGGIEKSILENNIINEAIEESHLELEGMIDNIESENTDNFDKARNEYLQNNNYNSNNKMTQRKVKNEI